MKAQPKRKNLMRKNCAVEKLMMPEICCLKLKIKKNHRQKIIQLNNSSNNLNKTLMQAVNEVGNKIKTCVFVQISEVEKVSFKRTIQLRKIIQIIKLALQLLKPLKMTGEALYQRAL